MLKNQAFTLTDIVQHYLSMSFLRQTQLFSAPYIQYDLVAAADRTHKPRTLVKTSD